MIRLNRGQQVITIIGLGLVLWFVGQYVSTLGSPFPVFGWVAYAPLSHAANPQADLTVLERFFVWLGLITIWVVSSLMILRRMADPPKE